MKLFARIGVGIGTAKIEVNEPLQAGSIHSLPAINVVNTGDQAADYELGVEFHEGVPELRPEREWFRFKPEIFTLDPGESQLVEITLDLPIKTQPGDYFCYLEGRSLDRASTESGTSIGVAAGAKTYFSIAPANLWQGIYYKIISLWTFYAPWTQIVAIVIGLTIAILILKRYISLDIGIGLKKKESEKLKKGEVKKGKKENEEQDLALLGQALSKVDEYTGGLPEQKQQQLFVEAKEFRKGVLAFLRKGNEKALPELSEELRNVLIFSREGLEEIKSRNRKFYKRALKIVTDGLLKN